MTIVVDFSSKDESLFLQLHQPMVVVTYLIIYYTERPAWPAVFPLMLGVPGKEIKKAKKN